VKDHTADEAGANDPDATWHLVDFRIRFFVKEVVHEKRAQQNLGPEDNQGLCKILRVSLNEALFSVFFFILDDSHASDRGCVIGA
jgi:hypothetical protein